MSSYLSHCKVWRNLHDGFARLDGAGIRPCSDNTERSLAWIALDYCIDNTILVLLAKFKGKFRNGCIWAE